MQEYIVAISVIFIYFIIAASSALIIKKIIKPPQEVFRKILHIILLGSLPCFVYTFSVWWVASLAAITFAVIVYPILAVAQNLKGFSNLLCERKYGEIKSSLLIVFFMFAIVIAVCWGWLGDKVLVLVSVYAWGFGDAAAALIGKKYGVRKIYKKKSLEGTLSMLVASFSTVLILLLIRGGMAWYGYIVTAFVTGIVSAAVELYTLDGMDTITVPISAMLVMLPFVELFGGVI